MIALRTIFYVIQKKIKLHTQICIIVTKETNVISLGWRVCVSVALALRARRDLAFLNFIQMYIKFMKWK
jgi:hypothetical protein